MTHWQEVSLTALGSVERGRSRHRPRNDPRLFGDTLPFFQTGDVKAAMLHMTSTGQYYSDFGVDQSRVWEPGITCITIAANIAESAVLGRRGCFPDSVLGFTPTHQPEDAYFVKYLLDVHRERLTAAARGTTQDNLSLEKLLAHRFPVPDPETRLRIAVLLRSFDELIENNRRRVEVLEEMARAIYREWFVHFRYPGHEDATFIDSLFGHIPEGWSIRTVAELSAVVTRGIAPKYNDDGHWTVLNQKCIRHERVSLEKARRQERGVPASKQIQFGDVLINSTGVGTLGRVALFLGDHPALTADSHVTIVRPAETVMNPWFGMSLVSRRPEFEALGTGSTGQTELSRHDIGALRLVCPQQSVLDRYAEAVWPLLTAVPALFERNRCLASIRDLILPKLLTGQVDVSSLDLDALVDGASR
ncbi:restriction endonuclease subunit S [Micromonospora chersina]|uniref:restriction endonuclease subunit S n=1 Tax=Micromonospora chersina TaxID=47854 RepID=UPI00371C4AF2